jgi:F-type H+-transporting ATPase subunit b
MLHNPEVWVLVSFVIFFVLFGRRLWGALTGLLDGRAATIRAGLDQAAKLRAEAEQMLEAARKDREAALDEARQVLERSRAEAARLTEAAHEEAAASARRRERMALDRIAAAEAAAVTEVRQTAAELSIGAAQIVIGQGLGEAEDAAILDEAIASLPRALRAA